MQLAALGTALATSYPDLRGRDVSALAPVTPGSPTADPAAANRLGWTLGFSAPSATTDLAVTANQAERALRHALAAGMPSRRHQDRDPSVHSLAPAADSTALARARFAAPADAPSPGYDVLLETLRTWLAHHGSWDRAATALGLHRNTVRQRVARIGDLLDLDLHDPDVRMEPWFALHWLPGERPSTEQAPPAAGSGQRHVRPAAVVGTVRPLRKHRASGVEVPAGRETHPLRHTVLVGRRVPPRTVRLPPPIRGRASGAVASWPALRSSYAAVGSATPAPPPAPRRPVSVKSDSHGARPGAVAAPAAVPKRERAHPGQCRAGTPRRSRTG
ncbi:helix-turn-helix domain-containing protein [Embleya sp. NPDC008237]|uniref:helix-turn-helix domain-containing protein n=1 Tax=Embleya sp. NPDC008237 TaxID=3363978 RepID=UPI0036EF4796